MESLLCDRIKMLKVIDNIEDELRYIKNELKKVSILEEVTNVNDVTQDTKHPEKEEIILNKKEKVKANKFDSTLDTGYTDYYDMNSRPEFHI